MHHSCDPQWLLRNPSCSPVSEICTAAQIARPRCGGAFPSWDAPPTPERQLSPTNRTIGYFEPIDGFEGQANYALVVSTGDLVIFDGQIFFRIPASFPNHPQPNPSSVWPLSYHGSLHPREDYQAHP